MKKVLGIAGLLVAIFVITAVFSESFLIAYNLQNIIRWTALFGILSIGAGFVIITGGIDLSVGSIVGLIGCLMPLLFVTFGWPAWLMLTIVLAVAVGIGVGHGLLITKLRLQPFVVTLCGLLLYRGIARYITEDKTLGFGSAFDDSLRLLAVGKPFSFAFFILLAGAALAIGSAVLLARDQRAKPQDSPRAVPTTMWRAAALLFGLLLIVIGSSRFWFGFETDPAQSWLSGGRLIIPERGETMPVLLAWWSGAAILIPAAAALLFGAAARLRRRAVLPLIFTLMGLAGAIPLAILIRRTIDHTTPPPVFWRLFVVFVIVMGVLVYGLDRTVPPHLGG